jgi:ABC-type nitrate/sulfonate/bicarbonate transport system substrate-binding protein
MKLLRREFLHLVAGAAAVPATAFRPAWAQEAHQRVRVATGLLATWQSTAWLGAEAGLFKKRGIDMTLPAIAVGVRMLLRGSSAATGSSPTPALSLSRNKYSKAATL